MKTDRLFETIRDLLFPPKCLICSDTTVAGKSEICDSCLSRWRSLTAAKCPRCGKTAERCRCNFLCLGDVKCAGALFFYDYTDSELADGKRLIYTLKRSRDRRIARFLARETAAMLLKYCISEEIDPRGALVTAAPRSDDAVREYGFDHGAQLAHLTAYYIGAQYESLFVNKGGIVQKNLSAANRRNNAEEAIALSGNIPPGKICILIDDVITTGATLGVCANLLCSNGATDVICATVAAARNKTVPANQHPAHKEGDELWFKN